MEAKTTKPECAAWGAWLGFEVEGQTSLGVKTLFIRRMTQPLAYYFSYAAEPHKVQRVWFCKEFTDWPKMRTFIKVFPKRVIEVSRENYHAIPQDIRANFEFYFKVPYTLRPGDHVCVGPAFNDESFLIGQGKRVMPGDYSEDIQIGD